MSQNAKVGKISRVYQPVSGSVTISNVVMRTQNIDNWKKAIDQAKSNTLPRRRPIIELYDQIAIDGQMVTVLDKLRASVTNVKPIWIPDTEDSSSVEQMNKEVINTLWFYKFLAFCAEAEAWGFSLVELLPLAGKVNDCTLIPRTNVFPEYNFLNFNYANSSPQVNDGINYVDDPTYKKYLIFIGEQKSYGKIMSAAQYVIYKRGGFGDWSTFAELFGMPFRDAEYDPHDDVSRLKLQEAMENFSGNGWIIRPKGTSIQLHDVNASGKSEVYKDLVNICDEQISKIFLGQTMTTDNGSSRSQSEVHQQEQDDLKIARMIRTEYILNECLKPRLIEFGYPCKNGRFGYPEANKLPLDKLVDLFMKAATMVDISPESVYSMLGLKRPKDGEIPVRISKPDPVRSDTPSDNSDTGKDEPSGDEKKKIKLNSNLHVQLSSLYSHALKHPVTLKLSSEPQDIDSILDRIANDIHSGKLKPGELDPDLVRWTATQLFEGVTQGYGSNLADYAEDSVDYNMLKHLKENVHVFSGFKTHAQLREATNLLTNAEGQIKSFAQFREDIMPLNKKFNEVYLQAEHQHAIAASQMAGNWVDIEAAADTLPNLTFKTAGDDHVRPEHAILNGLTYPVNDAFWSTYYPPLDWGCRCDVIQNSDDVKKAHPTDLPKVKDMFAVNWGKDKIVFPDTHPYFDVSSEEKKNINDQLNNL